MQGGNGAKRYAFASVGQPVAKDSEVKVTSESVGLSEEIKLAMELNGQTEEDLSDMDEVRSLLATLYREGVRPTFFVPARQHEDLALALSDYGTAVKKPSSSHVRDVVNVGGVNTMANNTQISRIFDVKKALITFGRTPYIDKAGYVVEVNIPLESIVPLLTGAGGSFRGVVTLTVDHIDSRDMKVNQVVAPVERQELVTEIRRKLVDDCRELGLVA